MDPPSPSLVFFFFWSHHLEIASCLGERVSGRVINVGIVAEPLPRFMVVLLLSLDHAVWRNDQLGLCVCVIVEEPTCLVLHNWTESSTVLSCDGLIVRRFPWASISRHRDSVVYKYLAHGHEQRNVGMDHGWASEPGLSITRFTIFHSMVPLHSPGVDKLQAGRASQGDGRLAQWQTKDKTPG